MRSRQQNRSLILNAFNDYINYDGFNGVITPGDFYSYCKDMGRSSIDQSLIHRVDAELGVEEMAKKVGLFFSETKAQKQVGPERQRLLTNAFTIIEKYDVSRKSIASFIDDEDKGKLQKYVKIGNLKVLFNKGLDPTMVPNWPRNIGKDLLEKYANSDIQNFDEFLSKIKKPERLLEIKSSPKPEFGVLYAKETNFKSKKQGYIVVKVGKSNKSDQTRSVSSQDIMSGFESRIYGTHDTANAEDEALRNIQSDHLCRAYIIDGKSPRSRSQELFELPSTHFDTFAQHVKNAARNYISTNEVAHTLNRYLLRS